MSTSESLHHLSDNSQENNNRLSSSTGLLSPNPSFSSLSSSSSAPSPLSQLPHTPRTPRTPIRSVHHTHHRVHTASPVSPHTPKARPSPLIRLLLPFNPTNPHTSPSAPTSRPSSPTMTLHHPTPNYSQPPSPTTASQRPPTPSRSEKLLRDALLRDELERQTAVPLPSSPLMSGFMPSSPSPKKNGHRRRHSHVPVSSTSASAAAEEFTRGSFLFRTAMNQNSPRSPSPSRSPAGIRKPYGGDAEGSIPSTPHRAQPFVQQQRQYQQTPNSTSRRAMSPMSNHRSSTRSEHSPSPSPMRRRDLDRPPPLPLENPSPASGGANLQRHHSAHTALSKGYGRTASGAYQQQQEHDSPSRRTRTRPPPIGLARQQMQVEAPPPTAIAPGEPLMMTPHEQVLRAQLERVLNVGRVAEKKERRDRGRSESGSRKNEVRDEEGGWPWREAQRSAGSITSSPLYSSASGSSQSSQAQQAPLSYAQSPRTASRTRSKTDPTPPQMPTYGAVPSPRRSTTAPNPSASPAGRRVSVQHQRTGTTPPLMADVSPGLRGEDGDMRLLTPPPTPPFTAKMFSLGGGVESGYCPSPYKTQYAPSGVRRGGTSVPPLPRGGLGAPRRPANAPVGQYSSSSDNHEQEHEDESSSCSSRSFPPSTISSTYANGGGAQSMHPAQSPPATASLGLHHRPQFNARKASAQCRAMEGYVSFATVEGLGEPPADPLSPTDGDEEERGRKGPGGVLAWGVGGFRKLLGVVGVEHAQEGVVL